MKLQFAFATNDQSVAPSVVGPIRLYFTVRPILIDEITMYLQVQDDENGEAYDKAMALQALQNSGPVLVSDDYFGDSYYVRVADVDLPPEFKDGGGSPDRPKAGHAYTIPIVMHRWNTTGSGITP